MVNSMFLAGIIVSVSVISTAAYVLIPADSVQPTFCIVKSGSNQAVCDEIKDTLTITVNGSINSAVDVDSDEISLQLEQVDCTPLSLEGVDSSGNWVCG